LTRHFHRTLDPAFLAILDFFRDTLDLVATRAGVCGSRCEAPSPSHGQSVATLIPKASVRHREPVDPGSDRSLVRTRLPSVIAPEFDGIELQHAYRALQFLAEAGPEPVAGLTGVMTELRARREGGRGRATGRSEHVWDTPNRWLCSSRART
jgi:hypothetical protein